MSKVKSFISCIVNTLLCMVFTVFIAGGLSFSQLTTTASAASANWKFDLGANATSGYTSVSASTAYNASQGYGFANTSGVKNVSASGSGALSDAVQFTDTTDNNNTFNVDVPNGLYSVTITLGNTMRTSIFIEHMLQIVNMTGDNAVHTIQVSVTDGQLNVRAAPGKEPYAFSISAIEINRISSDPTLPNTVWMCGDSTVCNYYPLETSSQAGWGQVLNEYLPSGWNVQNMAASGQYAKGFVDAGQFDVIEKNGKKGDVFTISIGINDTNYSNGDEYYATVTDMVKRAKAKGMVVILVKQQGRCSDLNRNPLLSGRWFGGQLDQIGEEQNVQVIDLFNLFQDYNLANGGYESTLTRYCDGDDLHPNRAGAKVLAELVSKQIDWNSIKNSGENPAVNTGAVIDTSLTYMLSNVNSGLYMAIEGDTPTDGANVAQQPSNKLDERFLWTFEDVGDGYYHIYSALEGGKRYLLDVAYNGTENGTNIGIWGATNADAQLFRLIDNGDGSYIITTKATSNGSAIEVKDALTTTGGNIQQWERNGHNCQSWLLEAITLATKEPSEVKSVTIGDINKDGNINTFDLMLLKKHLNNNFLDESEIKSADVNADETISIADAVVMQKHVLAIKDEQVNAIGSTATIGSEDYYYAIDQNYNRGWREDTNAGFKGEAYVNLDNKIGTFVEWNVSVPEAGNYLCLFNVANGGTSNRQMRIDVNGATDYWVLDFLPTGNWTMWTEQNIVLPMNKGVNTIRLTSFMGDGGPNFDYMRMMLTDEPIAETYVPPVAEEPDETVNSGTVYIAGDSTVQTYRSSYAPQQGWGAYLENYITSDYTVANKAIAGRSSKSFYDQGRLQSILDEIDEGDFLLVQFAINDSAASIADRYAPVCGGIPGTSGSYEWYIAQYIEGVKAKGATPVLVTTTIGLKAYSNGKFVNSYGDYCDAMKKLAEYYNIPCVDLNTLMVNHYNSIGYDVAYMYHMCSVTDGSTDMTHFTETGANAVAKLIAEELNRQGVIGLK